MDWINRSQVEKSPRVQLQAVFSLLLISLLALSACSNPEEIELEEYESSILQVAFPKLEGWQVQYHSEGDFELGTAFLNMKNDTSGIQVTRAPLSVMFPTLGQNAEMDEYISALVDSRQETIVLSGSLKEEQKEGYRQVVVPIEMDQIADIASPVTGFILLAITDEEAVAAIFYCSVEKPNLCEKDLTLSVKGFNLLNP